MGRSSGRERLETRGLRIEPLESRRLLTAVVMSGWEQLVVELVNRARSDPAAEAARYGIGLNAGLVSGTISPTPKQPLAPHQALRTAAAEHSQDMLDRDYFSHTNPEGQHPWDRMLEAGYVYSRAGENISWIGSTGTLDRDAVIYTQHEGLFESPGHRVNILEPEFRELGAGVRHGKFTTDRDYNASMLTENFGTRSGNPFITGVVYDDAVVADDFYTIGEGWGNVAISAVEAATGTEYVTQSGPSGGYSLRVPAGSYTVTASGGELAQPIRFSGMVVEDENLKVDFDISDAPLEPPPVSMAWQNPAEPLDVNADASISPLDALIVINHLNRSGAGPLPMPSSEPGSPPPPYLDVSGTGSVGPTDALLVINYLNRVSAGGELSTAASGVSSGSIGVAALPAEHVEGRLEAESRGPATARRELTAGSAPVWLKTDVEAGQSERSATGRGGREASRHEAFRDLSVGRCWLAPAWELVLPEVAHDVSRLRQS